METLTFNFELFEIEFLIDEYFPSLTLDEIKLNLKYNKDKKFLKKYKKMVEENSFIKYYMEQKLNDK